MTNRCLRRKFKSTCQENRASQFESNDDEKKKVRVNVFCFSVSVCVFVCCCFCFCFCFCFWQLFVPTFFIWDEISQRLIRAQTVSAAIKKNCHLCIVYKIIISSLTVFDRFYYFLDLAWTQNISCNNESIFECRILEIRTVT